MKWTHGKIFLQQNCLPFAKRSGVLFRHIGISLCSRSIGEQGGWGDLSHKWGFPYHPGAARGANQLHPGGTNLPLLHHKKQKTQTHSLPKSPKNWLKIISE